MAKRESQTDGFACGLAPIVLAIAEEVAHLSVEPRRTGRQAAPDEGLQVELALRGPGHRQLAREVGGAEQELTERRAAALTGVAGPDRGLVLVGVAQPREVHDRPRLDDDHGRLHQIERARDELVVHRW